MTTPARNAEADRVELVYQWALLQVGARTIEEALALWEQVPATQQAATASEWLSRAVELVMRQRARSQEVTLAYYRLVRALRTGTTISLPSEEPVETVSLEKLRQEFEGFIEDVAAEVPQDGAEQAADAREEAGQGESLDDGPEELSEDPPPLEEGDDDDDILMEEIERLDQMIEEDDQVAEELARDLLDELGVENLLDKLDEIPDKANRDEARDLALDAHRKAGVRQASIAENISLNAARGLTYNLADADKRAIGWARYSPTGTPCGWCAMLISRGPTYKSRRSAESDAVGSSFHPNCHCRAVPIFSQEQFENSPLFKLNREYADLWRARIQGRYGGDKALSVWRRMFRNGTPGSPAANLRAQAA